MSKKENVEDLFSDAFTNYEAPVDPSAWHAIQNGLNAGAAAGSSAPSGNIWTSIAAKVPGGIAGIGAAVVGGGIIIGSIYYFTQTTEKVQEVKPGVVEIIDTENPIISESEKSLIDLTQVNSKSEKAVQRPISATKNNPSEKEEERSSSKSPANQTLSFEKKGASPSNSNLKDSQQANQPNIISVEPNKEKPKTSTSEVIEAPVMKQLARIQANPVGGVAPLTVTFRNDAEGKTIKWDFGDSETSKSPGAVKFTFNKAGKQAVILSATDATGKVESDTIYIDVLPSSEISQVQNVFTPNEDGLNDVFRVQGKDLAYLKVSIFGANGKMIHSWEGEFGFWDGKLGNGELAPAGPYYYVIQAIGSDSKKYKQNGTVNLIR